VKRNSKGRNSLKEDGGTIDRGENLELFSQIVNGLVEIHKNNVIHRDLKPENIFIDNKDRTRATAKIGDFGLARMLVSVDEKSNEFSTEVQKS